MEYRPEIDGLRALAVLPVILFHAGFATFGGGFVGVDVFFVISGYLITSIVLQDIRNNRFSIVHFYERRARRLLPALFLVMFACLPWAWFFLSPQDLLSFSKSLISTSGFASNLLFWSERGYFGTATELKPLIHTWSLAIEEQFYLVFPFALLFMAKKRIPGLLVLCCVFLLSMGLCIWLTPVHRDSAFFLLPTRLWELLAGSFAGILLRGSGRNGVSCNPAWLGIQSPGERKDTSPEENIWRLPHHWNRLLSSVGLLLITVSFFSYDKNTLFPGYAALAPVLGTVLIILFGGKDTEVGQLLGNKVLVSLGLISYSAYLWHQPILAFSRHGDVKITPTASAAIVGTTFLISYFSWKYVEQPWRTQLFKPSTVLSFSLAGLSFFSVIGMLGVIKNGFIDRYPEQDRAIIRNLTDAPKYVGDRFDKLKLSSFDPAAKSRKKVLVIGDSFGKDLVNAIYESKLINKLQISTHQINSECGNLYLDEDFTHHIPEDRLARCQVLGWYDNAKLLQLIHEADQIWLASSWSMWVAEKLPASVSNLERDFGKPVIVFSTKNFGVVNFKALVKVPSEVRPMHSGIVKHNSIRVQEFMRNVFAADKYVDIGAIMSGGNLSRCRWFNDDGEPLSFDGSHLTRAGCRFLGEKLDAHPVLKWHLDSL